MITFKLHLRVERASFFGTYLSRIQHTLLTNIFVLILITCLCVDIPFVMSPDNDYGVVLG